MSCEKAKFRTKADAVKRVKEINSLGDEYRRPKRVYKCPICRAYHLTSKPKRKKQTPLDSYNPAWSKLINDAGHNDVLG
jgi:hypothetical protein